MIETKSKATPDLAVDTHRSTPVEAMLYPPEKPRGFFSFLAGPLFLAQLFSTDQVLGGVMRSADAEEETKSNKSAAPQELG